MLLLLRDIYGNFLNVPVRLNTTILSIIFVLCLIPYWIQWKIYKYFESKKSTLKNIFL